MTGDERAKTTLAPDLQQAHARSIGIDRDITGAGFHDSENARDRGGRFVQIKPDPVSSLHSVGDQGMSDLVAQPIQFAVGQRLIAQANSF